MTKTEKVVMWLFSGIIFVSIGYAWRMYQEKQWVQAEISEIRQILFESETMLEEHKTVLRGYKILVTKMEVDRQQRARRERGK